MKHIAKVIALLLTATLLATVSTPLWAQTVEVKDAWARATVQGQKASGAFMKITAKEGATLVGVSSPLAGVAEVHEMKMDDDVMKMRALDAGLALPAGKAVELKPGGYHVMLMDLKLPLLKDTTIPLTLTFKDAKGALTKQVLKVPVSTMAPGSAAAPAGSPPKGEHKH